MFRSKLALALLALCAGILLSLVLVRARAGRNAGLTLVPWPEKVEPGTGTFVLQPQTAVVVDAGSRTEGDYLAQHLRHATGFNFPVQLKSPAQPAAGNIVLTTRNAPSHLGAEGYQLTVQPDAVRLQAPGSAGLFYGIQTLLQLLPPQALAPQPPRSATWPLPCLTITDKPRFQWRGLMLDVSRHFFSIAELKQLLDAMAFHKLNVFHWHLTDDQGWRLQIQKYPRLTDIGAWRSGIEFNLDPKASHAYGPDGRYGGFYTPAQVREIVAYAQARHITIVPEIELPGHATAALAAYPEFSCFGQPYSTDTGKGAFPGVYCPGKEATFAFLQDVLAEVCELFPGKCIHIGGDEVSKLHWRDCPNCQARIRTEHLKDEHELQAYFVHRIGKFLQAQGRTLVGWSEIGEGGLEGNAVLMDWIGGGAAAARSGHDVVMTPETACYLDFYQSRDRAAEPRATAAYLPLEKVYAFDPIPPGLNLKEQQHILGTQGNLWTEYIPSLKQAEYMAFPRLCALAEVAWSPPTARNWPHFQQRLQTHLQRLSNLGVASRPLELPPRLQQGTFKGWAASLKLMKPASAGSWSTCTRAGSTPGSSSWSLPPNG